MTLDQIVLFFQEWWAPIATLLLVALLLVADLFPKLKAFINEVEARYPNTLYYFYQYEQYVVDCYDRLPVRIRVGFMMIGGKQAWAWLVRAGYAYLRRKWDRK